jgi:hypothetical protein
MGDLPRRGVMAGPQRSYTLLGSDGQPYRSDSPATLGGHRKARLYGRLDCPAAQRAIARGGYVNHRVFFADEATAIAAGYRPCAVCLPAQYAAWKAQARPIPSSPQISESVPVVWPQPR